MNASSTESEPWYLTRMSIFLSHRSALEFWASASAGARILALCNEPGRPPSWRTRDRLPDGCNVTFEDVRKTLNEHPDTLTAPLHVVVPQENARSRSRQASCHVSSGAFPRGSFIRIGKGAFVSSLELCFIQMALELPLTALIRLGFEICGTYGIATVGRVDYARTEPFTTLARLSRFVESAGSMPGVAKARRALRHVVECAASPMETSLTMLLCLPVRMGGYALPSPQMNHEVNPGKRYRFAADNRCYYCDLIWPEASLALEYDGFEFHGKQSKMADDAIRRTKLLERGVTAVSLTKGSVRNLIELDRVAVVVAKRLGHRLRRGSPAWQAEQHKLHGMLLEFSNR